jgi:mono/diheme cytochrome c family protein
VRERAEVSLRRAVFGALALLGVAVLVALAAVALELREPGGVDLQAAAPLAMPEQLARGAYLARAGNCIACHTARGGVPYAGGRPIDTPFGTVYAGNLTPDDETGLGRWTPGQFWRALHHGRSRDGRLLVPAFPYPNYTQITRVDADALYAYLRSLPPQRQPNRAHALRFPYGSQPALAAWRVLFFAPGEYAPDPARDAQWNRGAYLVRGLGHCSACHAARNAFGATGGDSLELSGGLIPMQNWYAPSLASAAEAGVADWPADDVVALLKHGTSVRGAVMGPMAEVVYRSTQHLADDDLRAMAAFLQSLPQAPVPAKPQASTYRDAALLARGGDVYAKHCADCHGERGEGAGATYPPLAGNRAVTMASSANLVRIVLAGGFAPATAGNPRPYGMPPFAHQLNDDDVAALLTWLRASWGHDAPPVSALDVLRYR